MAMTHAILHHKHSSHLLPSIPVSSPLACTSQLHFVSRSLFTCFFHKTILTQLTEPDHKLNTILKVASCTTAILRRVSWEAGSARGVIAMWWQARMGGKISTTGAPSDPITMLSRHHLQVEARGSEFSGPWQLLDPLPGSDQLNLNLRFSIKARWVKRIVVISGFLCLQQRLIGKMESTGHQSRRH